jgi:hypothetical protein
MPKDDYVKSPLNKNEKWGNYVALKSLNNSSNIDDDFLNEVSYFKKICKVFTLIIFLLNPYLIFS